MFSCTVGAIGCAYNLTEPQGVITSPGYPNRYEDNLNCIWTITAPPGKIIQLTFNFFELEPNPQCEYDSIEVKKGHEPWATTADRYCGSLGPFTLYSSTGYMGIRMVTDMAAGGRGFNATYKIFSYSGKFVGNLPFDIFYLTTSTHTFSICHRLDTAHSQAICSYFHLLLISDSYSL